jgi:hypothetical protein
MVHAWWAKESSLWLMPLCLAGPLTPFLVWYAKRGRHRAGVLFTWIAITVFYGAVGAAGILARMTGQPAYIWVSLTYPGVLTALAYGFTFPLANQLYARAELRKSVARDLA